MGQSRQVGQAALLECRALHIVSVSRRNVYRGTPKMFSLDGESLALAKQLIVSLLLQSLSVTFTASFVHALMQPGTSQHTL